MLKQVKRGAFHFSREWEHLESHYLGPFLTQIRHRLKNGSLHEWTSRRHRKGFGSLIESSESVQSIENKKSEFFLWSPSQLNWWIAVLFMIGAAHFITGSILFLSGTEHFFILNLIFFIGSLFFTTAAYCQYHQSINANSHVGGNVPQSKRKWVAWQPDRIDFWVTFTQFVGTLLFNVNTFDAFLSLDWIGQNLLIWMPDMIGSILFQISGTLAVFEICHRWWCCRFRSIDWWMAIINFVGCVAFFISALFAFVRPSPVHTDLAMWATIFTLIGAICFFVGAYLIWPEMSQEPAGAES